MYSVSLPLMPPANSLVSVSLSFDSRMESSPSPLSTFNSRSRRVSEAAASSFSSLCRFSWVSRYSSSSGSDFRRSRRRSMSRSIFWTSSRS